MTYQYSYKELLARAERVTWQVDDLIGGDKQLDFSKPFIPEGLARTEKLDFLNAEERRTLNQVRGHAYLSIFGLVEEFILPFVMDHARGFVHGDSYRERALLEFAGEEAKHIQLFRRFREEFVAGDLQSHLFTNKGEALTQLQQEFLHVLHQLKLQFPFAPTVCHCKEIKDIRILGGLLREV